MDDYAGQWPAILLIMAALFVFGCGVVLIERLLDRWRARRQKHTGAP